MIAQAASTAGSNITVIYTYAPTNALPAGQYEVVLDGPPSGYTAGPWTPTNGQEQTTPTGLEEVGVTVGSNTGTSTNNNFSFFQPASISGTVYNDLNDDGQQELPNETVVPNIIVTLQSQGPNGTQTLKTTTTNSSGQYQFTNLAPGTYSVSYTLPANEFAGAPNNTDNLHIASSGTKYSNIALTSGFQGTNFNFGIYPGNSLSGTVYDDLNDDGNQDPGDPGVNDITVTLQTASGTQTTQTNSSGQYTFTNLAPGTYSVSFTPPANTFAGPANKIESPTATATGTQYSNISLTAGNPGTNFNFGIYQGDSLSGTVYDDLKDDGNQDPGDPGVNNITVTLQGPNGTQTTQTNSSGQYTFTNLAPGTYSVSFTPPANTFAGPANKIESPTATATGTQYSNIFLTAGNPGTNFNFGIYPGNSLSGTVYDDLNDDGNQDAGDPGVGNVTVTLQGPNGTKTTQTNSSGQYTFTNLAPGTYSVSFTPPTNTFAGPANKIESPTATATGTQYSNISLTAGSPGTNFNFGIVSGGSLSGYVDLDTGGLTTGLSGIQVTLTNVATGQIVATTTTDDNGAYLFNNLLPGTYLITKAVPVSPLTDEPQVAGNLGVNSALQATATEDQFYVNLGTVASGRNIGTNYDFYEDVALPPPPPPTLIVTPPPPTTPMTDPSKYYLIFD